MITLETAPTVTRAPDGSPSPMAPRLRSAAGTLLITLPPALLTLVMTVVGIGTRSLWNDEYATWYAATLSFADLKRLVANVDAVVAPYYLLMHGWVAVIGESATSLRMPSALAMAAAAGLIALIGRRLFDAGVGLTAGLLFAGLPAVCRYGQEARPYSFAIALAALATLMLLRAVEQPTWRRWILYGLCLIGAALVHIVTLSILLAHALYMWHAFRSRGDFRLLRWIAGAVIAVTGALPLAAKGHDQASAIDWIQLNGTAIAQLPERIFGSALVAAVVAGAAALAAVLLWTRHRNSVLLLLAWAVFPPLFCLVTFPVLHLFLHRYLLFTLPAWALLAAALGFSLIRPLGVASGFPPRVGSAGRRRSTVALSLAGLLVVAAVFYVGVPGQEAARHSPVVGEPDFRGAARSVEAREEPGDAIAFAGAGRNGRRAFGYETRLTRVKPTDILVARTSEQIGQFGTLECADPGRCVGNTRRIWLITATENYEDPLTGMTETIQAYLNSAFTFTEIQSFEHARLFLLNRKA
jgi:mannosyltransferase